MPEPHSPSFLLCQEHYTFQQTNGDTHSTLTNTPSSPLTFPDNHHLLLSLLSKESATHSSLSPHHDVVRWIFRVSDHYGFTPLTTVLAINYFDRFVKSIRCQIEEPPWMTQLVAVACVSLAAKVEETQVPLLFDLQVPSKYVGETIFVFEAKTIQRMELLVLSTLEWKMNPVTPISFFQHILTRLGLKRRLHWEFLRRCQRVLLSVIADSRVMSYLPSTLAAAIMIHVIKEIEPCNATEYRNQLLGLLKSSEEQVNGCYKLMLRLLACCEGIRNLGQRPKRLSEPSSPDYPAVDPSDSISTMLPPRIFGEEHYDIAQRVKQTLQRYKELQNIIAIFGLDELSEEDRLTIVRAQKIERFLSQSFFAAEELFKLFMDSGITFRGASV